MAAIASDIELAEEISLCLCTHGLPYLLLLIDRDVL